MEQRFKGKVAVVTGAGQGIGQGIALRLAQEGAAVVIAEYNPETAQATAKEIEAQGGRAMAYQVDISKVDTVNSMVEAVVTEFGHIDILVNNAGVVHTKPMLNLTENDWDHVVNVNQRGMFFCLQAVAAQMIKQIPKEIRASQGPADIMSIKENETTSIEVDYTNYGKIINLSLRHTLTILILSISCR